MGVKGTGKAKVEEKTTEDSTGGKVTSKIKILVVDDEQGVANAIRRYFAFEGYDIDAAYDPYTALSRIHKENFLIVISDIAMPGMTGVDLLRRIKSYSGMIQVIMITGYVTLDNILSCLRLGADDCFLKPLGDMSLLQAAVDEAIAKLQKWSQLMDDISKGRVEGGSL